jgi:hypothetical protein
MGGPRQALARARIHVGVERLVKRRQIRHQRAGLKIFCQGHPEIYVPASITSIRQKIADRLTQSKHVQST